MTNPQQLQQGSALTTGLIMLTAISLVSVSTLESALVQTNLATNAELKAITFQEAETSLKRANNLDYIVQSMNETSKTIELSYSNDGEMKLEKSLGKDDDEKDDDEKREKDDRSDGDRGDREETKTAKTRRVKFDSKTRIKFCGVLASQDVRGMSLNANQAANSDNSYVRYVFDITSTVKLTEGSQTQSQHSQRTSRLMMGSASKTCT
ncbi:MAG TPA: hypothetical protein ENK06_05355 [Gammaproteobacteria bacterium]|nr:hypothetical protein [Gammaproteobacteria bacterium]